MKNNSHTLIKNISCNSKNIKRKTKINLLNVENYNLNMSGRNNQSVKSNDTKRPRTNSESSDMEYEHQPNITTRNKFSPLRLLLPKEKDKPANASPEQVDNASEVPNANKTENVTPKSSKKIKIPPIVITEYDLNNQEKFINDLDRVLKNEFHLKFYKDCFKIFTNDIDDYCKLKDYLKNVQYFTYTMKQDKVKKLVLKASPNMDTEVIIENLKNKDINALSCINLKSAKNNNSYSYLVTFANEVEINVVKKSNLWEEFT